MARARAWRSRASPRDSTAWSASNGSRGLFIADIVLAADRRVGAVRTDAFLVRPRREFAALDPRHDVEQTRARIGEYSRRIALAVAVDHRNERLLATECDVGGFLHLPRAAALVGQPLLRAERVDRHLQRPLRVRRRAGLVVDDANAVGGEEIDAVGDAAKRHRPSTRHAEGKIAFEPVLEPPIDHIYRVRRFETQHDVDDP